jgi:hypothetical protein
MEGLAMNKQNPESRSKNFEDAGCAKCRRIDSAVASVREAVSRHPHFATRRRLIDVFREGDAVVVRANLPTFHLKQMLISLVRSSADGEAVVDEVGVATGRTCDEAATAPKLRRVRR